MQKFIINLLLFFLLFTLPLSSEEEKGLDERLAAAIQYDLSGTYRIGWIKIDDRTNGISQATWLYVKNALDYYKKEKPLFIVLELNTPGGELFAAQKISDALKDMDIQHNIPVVTFINNWAISAGAMLAYSSRFITAAKDASMGAAEPLTVEGGKSEVASEKVNSAIRADFANRAAFFGRNPDIAEAMVDKDVILVQREGKIIKLSNEDQIRKGVNDPDIIISQKGKLLTLNASELIKYHVADLILKPEKLSPLTAAEESTGRWPAEKSLLFTYPFFQKIPNATIDEYQMDWKTRFFVLLAQPAVSSLLFLGLMVGFYMEMSTPGFGLAGTIAITCLFFIALSSFSLEIANWLELILLLAGIAIILVELFILPTFGLLGVIGIALFFAGLFGMMLPGLGEVSFEFDTKTFNAAGEVFVQRLAWLSGIMLAAMALIVVLARFMTPSLIGFKRFILAGHEQEGYTAVESSSNLPAIGSKGVVFATMRPAGKVLIDNLVYDATSEGMLIDKGEEVIVDRIDGGTLVVKKRRGE